MNEADKDYGGEIREHVYLVRNKHTGAISHVCDDKWTARWLADIDEEIEKWPLETETGIPIFDAGGRRP